jgi:hypothetical protein
MTDEIGVLRTELSKANRKIAELTNELQEWVVLGSQHRADLNDKAGRWVVRYVLVVEYDFCKRKWRYFAHQMHLHPTKVKDGTALTFKAAKGEAESILKGWCESRSTPPDLKKLTPWRPLPRKLAI